MRLYFIRHGQSANNALWDATGSSKGRSEDPELTKIGHKQARQLADFIASKDQSPSNGHVDGFRRDYFGFTHLYTSLMVRSVATASYLSESLELPMVAWPEIHECGGIYEDNAEEEERIGLPGNPRSFFEQNYKKLVLPDTVTEKGWYNRPFEAHEERPLRAQRVLEDLLERHGRTDDVVAVVSHGAFYMEFSRVLWKIQSEMTWFTMNNTGITRIDFRSSGEVSMIYHNRTDHLPEELVT